MALTHTSNPFAGAKVRPTHGGPAPVPAQLATDRQVSFLRSLVSERELPQGVEITFEGTAAFANGIALTKKTASPIIDMMLKQPNRKVEASEAVEASNLGELFSGYFAVNGKRYIVDVVESGKWAGWVFFKTGSDYHEQQRLGRVAPGGSYQGKAADAFNAIVADPRGAAAEYGQITGRCGKCNRKLEDETSRALGIGPVCRAGW